MKKRILSLILVGILMLLSVAAFASCKKKPSEEGGDKLSAQDETKTNFEAVVSKSLEGNLQTDHGKQIWDIFTYEDIGNGSVSLTEYRAVTIGTEIGEGDSYYVHCHEVHDVVIPSEIAGKTVAGIGEAAFSEFAEIRRVRIPNTVQTIDALAFAYCTQLTLVELPASLARMGEGAFYACGALTAITLPTGLSEIPKSAFQDCTGLSSVTVPGNIKKIGKGAFLGCSGIVTLTLENGVVLIEDQAFQNLTKLITLSLPDSVTSVGRFAFDGCPALSYSEYDNARYLGNAANPYLALVKATSTSISSCEIHADTKLVFVGAFTGCSNLEYTVYENAKYLGSAANPYLVLAEAATEEISSCTIHADVKVICGEAFQNCSRLLRITVPSGVAGIGYAAFSGCTELTNVTIPNSVSGIGPEAFAGCNHLTDVTFLGTKAEWNAVRKAASWDSAAGQYTVHCTDGDVVPTAQ